MVLIGKCSGNAGGAASLAMISSSVSFGWLLCFLPSRLMSERIKHVSQDLKHPQISAFTADQFLEKLSKLEWSASVMGFAGM